MVHRLERDGLIALDERKEVHLTKSGKRHADSIVRRMERVAGEARVSSMPGEGTEVELSVPRSGS